MNSFVKLLIGSLPAFRSCTLTLFYRFDTLRLWKTQSISTCNLVSLSVRYIRRKRENEPERATTTSSKRVQVSESVWRGHSERARDRETKQRENERTSTLHSDDTRRDYHTRWGRGNTMPLLHRSCHVRCWQGNRAKSWFGCIMSLL